MEKHLQGKQEDIVFSEDSISVFFIGSAHISSA